MGEISGSMHQVTILSILRHELSIELPTKFFKCINLHTIAVK